MRSLQQSVNALVEETGLDAVKITLPEGRSRMDYTNLSLNVIFDDNNVARLLNSSGGISPRGITQWSAERSRRAYALKGDGLCKLQPNENFSCEADIANKSAYAARKMQAALEKMRNNRANAAEYTAAFAEFGKAAMTNQVTLGMALLMAGPGVEIDFMAEGTYFRAHQISFKTTPVEGQYKSLSKASIQRDPSLNPEKKRSRYHGLITNKSFSGLGAP
jgi:hypothetical protein